MKPSNPPESPADTASSVAVPARIVSARASRVILAALVVTAVSGYFMGLQQLKGLPEAGGPRWVAPADLATNPDPAIPRIVEYGRLGEGTLKPNAAWHGTLAMLQSTHPFRVAEAGWGAAPASDEDRAESVRLRTRRRAFDGAPPVIPHPVDAITPASCAVCHAAGLAVRGVVAPKMSHAEMGSCTQCHVPLGGPGWVPRRELASIFGENGFEGVSSAGRGARAWPGAPPTIPHDEWMRQDCASCHGPTGLPGMRTSHADRVSCRQCHVPDATSGLMMRGPRI